jgi:4-diphosphocytidyl-2-C-methyl-D-erythritol kinase
VFGRRTDGYHDLRTVFQSVALHDSLRIEHRRGPFVLECDDPACPSDRTNLVWRAAQAVWTASGRRGLVRDLRVRLTKRIPVQSGLGGGSSDAAATLRALAWQFRWRPAPGDLHAVATALGADVPFFLTGGTALGVDRGDVLFPLRDLPAGWIVLAVPPFGVSTKDAYQWLDEDRAARRTLGAAPVRLVPRRPDAGKLAGLLPRGEWGNDLELPVRARYPAIGRLVVALLRRGAVYAAMSGSGSAVFGVFAQAAAARTAARALDGPACRTVVTRTMGRRAFERRAAASRDLPATWSIG